MLSEKNNNGLIHSLHLKHALHLKIDILFIENMLIFLPPVPSSFIKIFSDKKGLIFAFYALPRKEALLVCRYKKSGYINNLFCILPDIVY